MPVYKYQAIDKRGRKMGGMMPALDESNLDQKLKTLGLWLTDAEMERPAAASEKVKQRRGVGLPMSRRKLRRELIDFCTLMTFQVRVGVPLVKALEVAWQDCKDENFQRILRTLQSDLESGMSFYEALAQHPNVFSTHFICVIRAGEQSSKLPETFEDLRNYLEWVEQVLADVKQATIYPAIVSIVIACFTIFLFSFIIPKFSALLRSVKVEEPLLTSIVFGIGEFTQQTWFIWLPIFLGVVIGVPVAQRTSPSFAFKMDQLKLKLPIFGELNQMLALSRFAHNLSILYRSGINIIQALEICQQGLIGNKVVEKAVGSVEQDVKTGSTISEAMHREPVFSAMLLRMINMGEASGNLDKALDNVADYYNDVIPRKIKKVFAVVEPMLMLFLIFIVGCVALAIYLPIISLMGAIK
jgi:type IV pilus assembly protein PilC